MSETNNLERWLTDPRAEKVFGRSFKIQLAILAALSRGDLNCAAIAKMFGVRKQSVHRHLKRIEAAFNLRETGNV